MKYELFFLNNIRDWLECANNELESFFDVIDMYENYDVYSIKNSIVNLSSAFELIIKYKLIDEHWSLVFSDINKATYNMYEQGDFISVDIKTGIARLKNICEISDTFSNSFSVYKYRNQLIHYTLTDKFSTIYITISKSITELTNFIKKYILELIPTEAKGDFSSVIDELDNKSTLLNDLAFIV